MTTLVWVLESVREKRRNVSIPSVRGEGAMLRCNRALGHPASGTTETVNFRAGSLTKLVLRRIDKE